MAHSSALVSSRDIGVSPLSVRVRTLSRLRIGPGVRVICLGCASAAVRCRNRSTSRVRSGVRIVTGAARCRAIRTVGCLFPTIRSGGRVIVRRRIMITIASVICAAVRRRVRIVVTPVTVWRPPIAAPISKNCSRGSTQDKRT